MSDKLRALLIGWPTRDVLLPFLVSRALLVFVGWLSLHTFQNLATTPGCWEIKGDGQMGPAFSHFSPDTFPLVNIAARWDAGWYHSIAKDGYSFKRGQPSNTAFFPAYPILMRAMHLLVPGHTDASWFFAGIIVSNLALLVALYYFVLLVRIDLDAETAARAALYLLVFPTAFFFSAVYAESVFVAAVIAAFFYARTDRWLAAGLCGAIATLARSPGILLVFPLLLEYAAQRGFHWRKVRPNVAALGLIPAALAGLMFYFSQRFGNPLAMRDAQAAWGGGWGTLSWPWQPYIRFFQQPFIAYDLLNFGSALVLLILALVAVLRLRWSYGLYAVVSYWFVTAWSSFDSVPRYFLPVFPAFVVLALAGRNALVDRLYLITSSGLAAFLMMRFALWRWVA